MTDSVEKREGWIMRLVIALCERMAAWLMRHDLGGGPDDGLLFMTYHSFGWEDAMMAQTMVRFKQIKDEVA